MAHKFSFIVLGGSGKTIRQINCSRSALYGMAMALVFCALAAGYGIFDYACVQLNLSDQRGLESDLAQQTEEVLHQREQIQKFAVEINSLKGKLVQLNQFEQKIRIIANIDHPNQSDGLFGVGGSASEDLNPNMELTQRHQGLIKDMHQQIGELDRASISQQDDFEMMLGKLEDQKNLLAHTPAIRPVRGMDILPVWVSPVAIYR